MMILGICGAAGAGKTTLARQLSFCGWKRTRFSQGLKSMLAAFLLQQLVPNDVVWEMLDGELKETPTEFLGGKTPRHAMQTLGTEWRETIDRNLWVNAWKNNIAEYGPDAKVLVDDLRFLHEADAIQELGGKIVRIIRNQVPFSERLDVGLHISETEALEIAADGEIINNSTPEKMLDQLAMIMEYWK